MYLCRHSVHATSSRSVHAARYVPGDAGNFAVSSPHVSHVTAGIIPRLFELVDKTLEQCLFRQQYTAAPPVYVCTRDGTHACARALIITFISLQFFSSAGNSRRDYTYIDRARDPACLPPPPPPPPPLYPSHHPFIPRHAIYYPSPSNRAIRRGDSKR